MTGFDNPAAAYGSLFVSFFVFGFFLFPGANALVWFYWEPVDTIVADPVRQDNDKRNNIQIYTEIPFSSPQSLYSYLVVILSNWVPDNWVYRLPIIFPGFSVQGMVLVNPFLRFTKTTDFVY